jgi:hypothetical protein
VSANTADCIGAIGASGTGKSLYALERLRDRGARPALIWSPLELTDNYAKKTGGDLVRTIPGLVAGIKQRRPVLVFVPSGNAKKIAAQFDLFCRAVWHTPKCVALIEELSRVTTPGWAPQAWQNLSTAGRHQGLTVIATAQRPAQIDKDFLGNCTEIRAFRVNYENDARAIASVMRDKPETFLELPDLHYIHRRIRERANVAGVQPIPTKLDKNQTAKRRPERATLP